MTVPIMIPSSRCGVTDTGREYRELLTGMKLLAGKDCLRDPLQAQIMLVSLTESRNRMIAEDAQALMRAALARDWLTTSEPKYHELERIAEKSVTSYRKNPDRQKRMIKLMLASAMLFAGFVVFALQSNENFDFSEVPMIMIVLILTVVVGVWFAVFKARR